MPDVVHLKVLEFGLGLDDYIFSIFFIPSSPSCNNVERSLVTGGDPCPGPDQGDPSPAQYSHTIGLFSLPSSVPTIPCPAMQILFLEFSALFLFFVLNLAPGYKILDSNPDSY